MDKALKHYIYVRDQGRCTHCSRPLKMSQVTIDHYVPRFKGGKDEIYNYVLSCRRCNKYKGVTVPGDFEGVHLKNFIQGVRDRKITSSVKGLKEKDLVEAVSRVERVDYGDRDTVFSSTKFTFHLAKNRIFKIEGGV